MTVGAQSNARLLRNRGADAPGHFEDVTRAAGVSQHRIIAVNPLAEGQTLTSSFVPLDDDLYPELVIAGTTTPASSTGTWATAASSTAPSGRGSAPTSTAWGPRWATTTATVSWTGS